LTLIANDTDSRANKDKIFYIWLYGHRDEIRNEKKKYLTFKKLRTQKL